MQFDHYSVFDYGTGSVLGSTESVNLTRLSRAVSFHFRGFCRLSKLREGSMHKVTLLSHIPILLQECLFNFV